jgi:hypothetical protein
MMVGELISRPVPAKIVRGGRTLTLRLVPAELDV